ncbi:hypothetical protein N0V93_004580 [Gnomoniopsis smithogilvyi]|uniref:Uncharacterized protein n=1 Tax=Gnomoniopsis smithogilvyi TaxID=1191159 RepID=A0A9W9CXC0_9PEZI|nr:hypothetical protein N0V93_004580 [Gnomoniopsis smithogilvyi]
MEDVQKCAHVAVTGNAPPEVQHVPSSLLLDVATERDYVRKLDIWLLPFLSVMYFFNSIDRSNLGNAETDGLAEDLHFIGQEYSLLVLLFYIPNAFFDLPLNLMTKRFSGREYSLFALSSLHLKQVSLLVPFSI